MDATAKENIFATLLGVFFISLYLPDMPVVTNILIAGLFVYCFFFNPVGARRFHLAHRPALLLMLLFFAVQIVSAALSTDRHEALAMLIKRSPLAIFPLSIGSVLIRDALRKRMLVLYAVITTLAALFCLAWSVCRSIRLHDMQWLYDDSLTVVIDRQSSYVAWMVTIALFCYAEILAARGVGRNSTRAVYTAMAFLLFFHYLLASRASLLFLCLVAICYTIYRPRVLSRVAAGAILYATVAVAFPKTLHRFKELQYTDYNFQNRGVESHYNMPVTPDQWNGANTRLAIWNCGLAVARRHWLTGVPLGDKEAALMAEFRARGFAFAYESKHKRDPHNTYLDVLINTGVPGLVLFIAAFVVLPLLATAKRRDVLGVAVVVLIATGMFSETWIDRQLGCLLVGFWLSVIAAFYSPLSRIYKRTASPVSPKKTRLPFAM
ncbi:MAG TPA: O-antigen ligase family protein [Puia sp.]|nr:O-antigen ligase family protein [Puia sp.]